MFGRRKAPESAAGSPLRELALFGELPPDATTGADGASLVMMELEAGGGVASVTSFADGTTSLYLSTGGGIIGAGTHPQANEESRAFVALAEALIESLNGEVELGQLPKGHVRFLVRKRQTILAASAAIEDVLQYGNPLRPLFVQGQRVLTLIRLIDEERAQQR